MGVTLKVIVDFINSHAVNYDMEYKPYSVVFHSGSNKLSIGKEGVFLNHLRIDNFLTPDEIEVIDSTAGDKVREYIKSTLS